MTRVGFTVAFVALALASAAGRDSLANAIRRRLEFVWAKKPETLLVLLVTNMLPQSTRSAQRSLWKLIDEAPETRLEPPASSPRSLR